MLQILKELFESGLSGVMIALLIFIGLLIFRKEVRKLVNWIVGFTRVEKTKEGYAVESSAGPRPTPDDEISSDRRRIASLEGEKRRASSNGTESEEGSWADYFFAKDYDKAIELLQAEVSETGSKDEKIRLRCIIGFVLQGKDFQAGVSYLEQLITEFPDQVTPYDWLARVYLWRELYEDCLDAIHRGLQDVTDPSSLREIEAKCLVQLGRPDEAITLLSNAISDNPSYADHYSRITEILLERDREAAELWFKKGLRVLPRNEGLLAAYAEFLSEDGRKEEALHKYMILFDIVPGSPRYLTLLGNVYLDLELNGKALEMYEEANSLAEEKQGWIIANIGNIYNNRGFFSKAIEHLNKALELDPDSQYAHERLSKALKNQEKENKKATGLREKGRQASRERGRADDGG